MKKPINRITTIKMKNDMKKILTLLAIMVAAGCSRYDDTAIWNSIEDIEDRLTQLEELCEKMNTNLFSLQAIVQALEDRDYITSAESLPNDEGYIISFASGKEIMIYHGKDGIDGVDGITPQFKIEDGYWFISYDNGASWEKLGQATGDNGQDGSVPKISVKQDVDGEWYWTVNGEWLLVDGHKIKATGANGEDAITPQFKIEDGYWFISYDNGASWEKLGQATGENGQDGIDGDSLFKEVTQDEDNVYFKLTDGSIITIPLYKDSEFRISFTTTDVAIINGGETKSISYQVENATGDVLVRTITQDGWKAVVNQETEQSGNIFITAPSPIIESEILVFATDGTNTLMSIIDCMQGVIKVAEDLYILNKDGETINIEVLTNVSYTVHIPTNAQSWLSISEPQTKAMRNETLSLTVLPNLGPTRYASVELRDDFGKALLTVIVKQTGAQESISESTDINAETLTVVNSICGDDIAFIRSMPNLKYLNLKDASIVSGGEPYFESNITEDNVIGDNMFNGLVKLETIILPDDVVSIGNNAFKGCTALSSLTFGNSLTEIAESAFSGCYGLTELTLPNAEILSENICNALKDSYVSYVIISEGTINLDYSFTDVKTLRKIAIPRSVETMNEKAFKNCSALLDVTFAPESKLKRIGEEAFYQCSSLKFIEIPSNVESIGGKAFFECSRLTDVSFRDGSKLNVIEDGYLTPDYSSPMYDNIYNEGNDNEGAFAGCTSLQHINLPPTLKKIGSYAFARCENLSNLELPNALNEIGEAAFAELGVSYITIPECISIIPPCLFSHCHNLVTVTLNNNLTTIGIRAFTSSSIQHIEIPDSVTKIEMQAFSYCHEINTVTLPKGLQVIEIGVFENSGLTEIFIPKSIREIKNMAFEECLSLEKVSFEDKSELQIIGGRYESETTGDFGIMGAFKRCSSLKSIQFPQGLKTIEPCAFYDCSSLAIVDASECRHLTTIGKWAFKDCVISQMKLGCDYVPIIADETFTVGENSILEVLEDNVDIFKTSTGWNVFSKIIAME